MQDFSGIWLASSLSLLVLISSIVLCHLKWLVKPITAVVCATIARFLGFTGSFRPVAIFALSCLTAERK
jgi:hypothetical protein